MALEKQREKIPLDTSKPGEKELIFNEIERQIWDFFCKAFYPKFVQLKCRIKDIEVVHGLGMGFENLNTRNMLESLCYGYSYKNGDMAADWMVIEFLKNKGYIKLVKPGDVSCGCDDSRHPGEQTPCASKKVIFWMEKNLNKECLPGIKKLWDHLEKKNTI